MSHVRGEQSLDPKTHFLAGMKDVFRFDTVRFINLVGTIQYGLLYAVVFFFAGVGVERLFSPFRKGVDPYQLIGPVLLQCFIITIVIFYLRKFVEAIPGILSFFPSMFNLDKLLDKGYIPYGIDEYKGEMMASLVLIGTQVNLLQKIGALANYHITSQRT
jgi:hypothetical protein